MSSQKDKDDSTKCDNIGIPNYTNCFWKLAFRKRFLGFCKDLDNFNKQKVVSRSEAESAWVQVIHKLHEEWRHGAGKKLDRNEQDARLWAAVGQIYDNTNNKLIAYWAKNSEIHNMDLGQPGDMAGITLADLTDDMEEPKKVVEEPVDERALAEMLALMEQSRENVARQNMA